MKLEDLVMLESDLKNELNGVMVNAILLGYKITEKYNEYSNNYTIEMKDGKKRYTVYINMYKGKVIGLWIDSRDLFRCSYSDFDENMLMPLKILNFVLANN